MKVAGMRGKDATTDGRTDAALRQHFDVERELAQRLRTAPKAERRYLYSAVYAELYRRVPSHPQLTRPHSPARRAVMVGQQLRLLARFVNPRTIFLEIGAGDCALSVALSERVQWAYAVDVSDDVVGDEPKPHNFALVLSDGCSIPVPAGSVDVAYSNQLMEHLHPDDAAEQLHNIFGALAPGGVYVCITPNRLNGPHDISRFFADTACGFHLREYTASELISLFHRIGFRRTRAYASVKGRYVPVPSWLVKSLEWAIQRLPARVARVVAGSRIASAWLGVQLAGWK